MNPVVEVNLKDVRVYRYRQSIWRSVWMILGYVVSGGALLTCFVLHLISNKDRYILAGFTAVGLMLAILVFDAALCGAFGDHKMPLALLARWARFSGRPVEEFPTAMWMRIIRAKHLEDSPMTKQFLESHECYARARMTYLAQVVNATYAYEEAIRQRTLRSNPVFDYRSEFHPSLMQRECRVLDALIGQAEKDGSAFFDAKVAAKETYLGFWDLMTCNEKNPGLGILTGPEWQNPEAFCKSLLPAPASAAPETVKPKKSVQAAKPA